MATEAEERIISEWRTGIGVRGLKIPRINIKLHLVQNLLCYSLLSKNLEIQIYRIVILCVVLYGCETWSLTLQEERRLRVFGNRVLRRIFGP